MPNKHYKAPITAKDLPYRSCVGIFLVNQDKHVFVGQRSDSKVKAWQMPQGGIDDNETIKEAAFRELFEETGIRSAEFLAESQGWRYYDLPVYLIKTLWSGKFRGQKQKWILFKFTGDEKEIQLDAHQREFSEWRWAKIDEVPDLAISFKRKIYKSVISEFKPIIEKL